MDYQGKTKDRRIACPWLIKNFADKEAEFIYVPAEKVKEQAKELDAIPFDIPDVEFTHHEDKCTFDYIIEKYSSTEPALQTIAIIVRRADTDRHDIASQASGLWAISVIGVLAYKTSYASRNSLVTFDKSKVDVKTIEAAINKTAIL